MDKKGVLLQLHTRECTQDDAECVPKGGIKVFNKYSLSKVQVRHVEGVWRMKLASGLNGPPQGSFKGTKQKRSRTGQHDIRIHIHLLELN